MITYGVTVEPEDIPVRGEFDDKEIEDQIIKDMEHNPWAWAFVTVTARLTLELPGKLTFVSLGHAHLGCCSYPNEEAFKQEGGYYKQLCEEALADLKMGLEQAVRTGELAKLVLEVLK